MSKTYTLTKAGREKLAEVKTEKTHLSFALRGIAAGKKTSSEITEFAAKGLGKVSEMEPRAAISWILFDAKRRGLVSSR